MTDFKTPQYILWKMTSAHEINQYLKEDISRIDRNYRKSQGMKNMKVLFEQFQYINFNIGSEPMDHITCLNFILFNPLDDIPIHVRINSIKNYILPCLPPHVKGDEEKLGRMLFVDNAFSNFLRCLDSFEITPLEFTIPPKKTKNVKLYYKHAYVGLHKMPLIIEVEHGKIIPLNFSAVTIQQQIPLVYVLNVKNFRKVVIDVKSEYITNIDIVNDSEIDIFYKVENTKNVIILNPSGIVKKKKYISIFLLYSNLEPTTITDTIIIHPYFNHFQKQIELNKIHVDLKIESVLEDIYKNEYKKFNIFTNRYIVATSDKKIESNYSDSIPAYSYLYAKNKQFCVAPTSISILYAPTNCIIKRLILISNCASSKDLKFKISNRSILPLNILKITPDRGVIKQGERHFVLFTFFLNDMLLDLEGHIEIKFQFLDSSILLKNKEQTDETIIQNLDKQTTIVEEVYVDTRKETKQAEEQLAYELKKKKKKESAIESLTFSYAQKICDNIQRHQYTYENINNTILQKAIQRLYGIEPGTDKNKNGFIFKTK